VTTDKLINQADEQLYRCKKEGRNRTTVVKFNAKELC
jgi:PleD family two-component response regulator